MTGRPPADDPAFAPTAAGPASPQTPYRDRACARGYDPGHILAGRYRIVAFLGEGGMGQVYRARDLVLDEDVAIKFLPAELSEHPAALERFLREVRVARQVSHPNVCRVHDIGNVDGLPFLSMEFIDGEDLASLLRRIGRLGRDKALELAHEICSGLSALHERGIVHRDLKPANIMIDGRGRARVTDFGLAAGHAELRPDEIRDGTPSYQAPEQLAGREVSPRSDVYALGAILFEMFSGRNWAEVPGDASARAVEAEAALVAIDPTVGATVRACLDPDPRRRPSRALTLAAALPGGDPLAAAMAAGRLPSPEVVANAATVGGISRKLALGLLLVTFLSVFVAGLVRDLRRMEPSQEHPPEVLVHEANEVLEDAGWTDLRSFAEARFFTFDERFHLHVRQRAVADDSTERRVLASHDRSALVLDYRRYGFKWPSGSSLAADDPPLSASGDAHVRLDANGRLLQLTVVPSDDLEPAPEPIDWVALIVRSGFDPAQLEVEDPTHVPPVFADARVQWRVRSENEVYRLEGASYQGRPVFWNVAIVPRDEASGAPEEGEGAYLAVNDRKRPVPVWALGSFVFVLALLLVVWFGTLAVKAVGTLRRHETDHLGARRLAYSVFALYILARLLQAQGVADVVQGVPVAAAETLLIWIGYLMVEPYARLRIPRSLIAWNRLVQGRVMDPLVGRDVLLGCCAGAALTAVEAGILWENRAMFESMTLLGGRFMTAGILEYVEFGVAIALLFYVVQLVFEAMLRRRGPALVAIVTLLAMLGTVLTWTDVGLGMLLTMALFIAVMAVFMFKAGLLATMVLACSSALLMLAAPDPFLQGWWGPLALMPLGVVTGFAVFGFLASTAPERRAASRTTTTRA